jgi:hypothetical protein
LIRSSEVGLKAVSIFPSTAFKDDDDDANARVTILGHGKASNLTGLM